MEKVSEVVGGWPEVVVGGWHRLSEIGWRWRLSEVGERSRRLSEFGQRLSEVVTRCFRRLGLRSAAVGEGGRRLSEVVVLRFKDAFGGCREL